MLLKIRFLYPENWWKNYFEKTLAKVDLDAMELPDSDRVWGCLFLISLGYFNRYHGQ